MVRYLWLFNTEITEINRIIIIFGYLITTIPLQFSQLSYHPVIEGRLYEVNAVNPWLLMLRLQDVNWLDD